MACFASLDDAYDRLHRKDMATLLLLFLLPILGQQYVGEPIQCMAPTAFSDAQVSPGHLHAEDDDDYDDYDDDDDNDDNDDYDDDDDYDDGDDDDKEEEVE